MNIDMKKIIGIAQEVDVSVSQMCYPAAIIETAGFENGLVGRFLELIKGPAPLSEAHASLLPIQAHVQSAKGPAWDVIIDGCLDGCIVEISAFPRAHYNFDDITPWTGTLNTSRPPLRRIAYVTSTEDLIHIMRAFRIEVDTAAMTAQASGHPNTIQLVREIVKEDRALRAVQSEMTASAVC